MSLGGADGAAGVRGRRAPGPAVAPLTHPDLGRWAGEAPNRQVLDQMTDAIMLGIRDLLAEIREGDPPPLYEAPTRRRNPPAVAG